MIGSKRMLFLILLVLLTFSGGISWSAAIESQFKPDLTAETLARELLEVNWQLKKIQQDKIVLKQELDDIERNLNNNSVNLELLLNKHQKLKQQLASWLAFIYKEPFPSFIEVLLDSADMSVFLTRWYTMSQILRYQNALLKSVDLSMDNLRQQQEKQSSLKRDTSKRLDQLNLLENRLSALQNEQSRALEAAREAEELYGLEILSREKRWSQMLSYLDNLLSTFHSLPWEKLEPQSVSLNILYSQATASFSREALEALLNQANPQADFRLELKAEILTLQPADDPGFLFSGSLSVWGGKLVLEPKSITLDGQELDKGLLSSLITSYDLTATVPEVYPGVTLDRVTVSDEQMAATFKLVNIR